MQPIITIKNLECCYNGGQTVLAVEQLDILRGKLYVVLGVSGIGKSTLIEALGLMSNTIRQQPQTEVQLHEITSQNETTPHVYNLQTAWHNTDFSMQAIRQQFFTFIFQNNNLMNNFTAGENMCMGQLIQGIDYATAKARVLETMQHLGLNLAIFDQPITNLSGGQRQRLSFIRAITSEYQLLFGDEPTGNLDRVTARTLLKIVRDDVDTHGRTGIIVSHDIELALQYADYICLIQPQRRADGSLFGTLSPANVLQREVTTWHTADLTTLDDPMAFISKYFTPLNDN